MKRFPLTHLLLIFAALAVLAAGAWWYTNANEPVEGVVAPSESVAPTPAGSDPNTPEACEEAGGVWNECASACPPDAEACILMCVQKCEGLGDGKTVVNVYFPNARKDPNMLDCAAVYPSRRAVFADAPAAEAALLELLAGPAELEKEGGAITSLPSNVVLKSVAVKNGTAYADFGPQLNRVAGSCRVTSIRAQIERTLLGIQGVKDVVISIDGKTDEVLQP